MRRYAHPVLAERENTMCLRHEGRNNTEIAQEPGRSKSTVSKAMRGLDDDAIAQRTGGFCNRDGWELNFYAEGDADWSPLKLTGIISRSFDGATFPFEELESFVLSELLAG